VSFWKSIKRKARKKHNCEYCSKEIKKGEKYSRETGTFEGDFNDYCLCLRCTWFLDTFRTESEYLQDLYSELFEEDLISCCECGSYRVDIQDISEDKQVLSCRCRKCSTEWEQDISLESLKDIASRHN
jgi:hypothetical protein